MTEQQFRNLQKILRNSCLARFASSLKNRANIDIIENVAKDDFLYGQWMTIILMSGPSIQSVLKLHYYSKDAKDFTALSLGIKKNDVKNKMMLDYMKELTNLFAGEIKAQFFNNDILVGISLPLVTRGFDEVLFSDKKSGSPNRDFWSMQAGDSKVIVTTEAEVFKPDIFNSISFVEASEDNEGDVDFL